MKQHISCLNFTGEAKFENWRILIYIKCNFYFLLLKVLRCLVTFLYILSAKILATLPYVINLFLLMIQGFRTWSRYLLSSSFLFSFSVFVVEYYIRWKGFLICLRLNESGLELTWAESLSFLKLSRFESCLNRVAWVNTPLKLCVGGMSTTSLKRRFQKRDVESDFVKISANWIWAEMCFTTNELKATLSRT